MNLEKYQQNSHQTERINHSKTRYDESVKKWQIESIINDAELTIFKVIKLFTEELVKTVIYVKFCVLLEATKH